MRTKMIALGIALLMMCAFPIVCISDETDAATGEKHTVFPWPYPNGGNYPWVTSESIYYDSYSTYVFNYRYLYFEDSDPFDQFSSYVNGKIALADLDFLSLDELIAGHSYWIAGFDYFSYSSTYDIRTVNVVPQPIYLEAGKYTVTIESTDCEYLSYYDIGKDDTNSIKLTEGRGSFEIDSNIPYAFYFVNNGGSSDTVWREMSVTYSIDPEPVVKKASNFDKTATILSNKVWRCYTTNDVIAGTYTVSMGSGSSSNYYLFEKGSAEEKAFIENVVNKNLIYGPSSSSAVISDGKVCVYRCETLDTWKSSYLYLTLYDGVNYEYKDYRCNIEEIQPNDEGDSKFFAEQDFSIAVKYDASKFQYVVMAFTDIFGNKQFAPLESERLYTFHMQFSGEYEIYGVVSDTATDIGPGEVKIYTENVPSPDNAGMVVAVIAIVLCVAAFSLLFISGRRPKWDEDTGLPDSKE